MNIPDDLKIPCVLCGEQGKVKRVGFASAGHMIERTCHQCKGRGYVLPAQEDLCELIANLTATAGAGKGRCL